MMKTQQILNNNQFALGRFIVSSSAAAAFFFMAALTLSAKVKAVDAMSTEGSFIRGSKLWTDNCSRCHNFRDPKDLRDDQWRVTIAHMRIRAGLVGRDTRDIFKFLTESNNSYQAPVKEKVTEMSPSIPEVDLDRGSEVFNTTCVACHGKDGKGAIPGTPDFTSNKGPLAKTDEVLVQHIMNGFQSPGSALAMPPKGGNSNLTEADIRSTLAFLRKTFSASGKNE